MPDIAGRFEMRRLEQLSNTVFGVAMTLLAYDLPRSAAFSHAPSWTDLLQVYGHQITGLAMAFIIAGMFWMSHHRRLALAPEASRGVVMLNLLFLMLVVLLPATNALNATFRDSSVVAIVYGVHLTLLAALNAWLWFHARAPNSPNSEFVGAIFPVGVFIVSTIAAIFNPTAAQYFMFLAFAGPFVGWYLRRRRQS